MKTITICGSLDFSYEIHELSKRLKTMGYKVYIPMTSDKILRGEVSLEKIKKEKEGERDFIKRAIENDVIRLHFSKIKKSDAILVTNYMKENVLGYIGGNTLTEISFAHVLNKKIYLLDVVPDMHYADVIKMMQPEVIQGDLTRINI